MMPTPVKNITKNILAVCIGLAIALIISEVTLRIWHPVEFRVRGDKILLPINKKYQINNDRIAKLDKKIIHTKNRLGFRGENPPKNFADYLTIMTVGGSTTECFYLNDNKTWTALLGKSLKKVFNKVWINNAGLDGCSTFGHIILLEDYLVNLKPKVIIFLVGINDVGSERSLDLDDKLTIDRQHFSFNLTSIKKLLTKSETCYFAINLWRNWRARKMGLMHANLDLAKVKDIEVSDNEINQLIRLHKEKYIKGYKNRLLTLIKLCKDNSIIPIFVTQPALYGKGFDDVTGKNLETVLCKGHLNGKTAWELLELYNDALRQVASSRDIVLVDLAREMPKSSKYYYDMHHCTNKGAQKVAQIIYQKIYPFMAVRFEEYLKGSDH
jgi:lysophospholipase L1-like esterase